MRAPSTLGIPAAAGAPLLLALAGCPKVEPVEAPDTSVVGLTLFAGFDSDWEKYESVVQEYIDLSHAFVADVGDGTGCFSWETLAPKDACAVDICGVDPSQWPSVGRSEYMEGTVEQVEAALLTRDWTEVFGNFDAYTIEYEAYGPTSLDEYLAGTRHYYDRDYIATVDAGIGLFSYFTRLQFRRVDDFQGTGHPLVLIRSWIPEAASSSSESLSMTVSFNFEIIAPLDETGQALRTFVSWSDARFGDSEPEEIAGVVCFGYTGAFDDINDWIDANYGQ